MRVVNIFYYYNEQVTSEEELISYYYTTTGWAEALQSRGVESIIMTRFMKDSAYQQNKIQHYFVKDNLGGSFKTWQIPWQFLKRIKALDADIIHVHSLTLSLQTCMLRLLLPKKTAIIVQHHGGKSPGPFKRTLHNLFNSVADAFFFTTSAQGIHWFRKKKTVSKVLPVMEGATFFNYATRDADRKDVYHCRATARLQTGMQGQPVLLWVGRLDANKDPLTVLAGLKTVFEKQPAARLYMIYNNDQLLPAVKQYIQSSTILQNRVHLLGAIPHEQMEAYYHSADYFVLGSHYEGSGYALSEALRCGCIPIITNIPSFKMMTQDGQLGALWQPGNQQHLIEAVTAAMQKPLEQEAQACIRFYQQQLSFEAIARVAASHYQHVHQARIQKINKSGRSH